MAGIMGLNWIILILSLLTLLGIGYLANRKVVQCADGESGFLLAGRSLGPWVGGGTIIATGFSGWGFMGAPGVAYAYGATELLGNFFFGFSLVISVLFFARFLYRKGVKMGALTIPEFIARSHPGSARSQRWLQGVSAAITAIMLIVFLIGQVKALGMLGGSWLNIPSDWAALLLMVVIIGYTCLGGMAAVAWTDTFMVLCMALATVYMLSIIFTDISFPQLLTSLNEIDWQLLNPDASRPYGSHRFQIFYLLPYTLLFACVLPYQSVRLMSLRPDVKAHQLALIIAPISLLLSFVPFVGLYMRVKFPELTVADEAMPMFLRHVVPPLASSIITLFILFAMQSTANSVLHVVSTSLSHDLRKALFPGIAISSRLTLKVNQLMVIGVGLLTLVIMLFMPPLMLNMIAIMGTGTLVSAFAGPVLIGTFWKGTATGALWSILTGFAVSGYLLLTTDLGWVEPPVYGALTGSLVYLVGSLSSMKKRAEINQKIYGQT